VDLSANFHHRENIKAHNLRDLGDEDKLEQSVTTEQSLETCAGETEMPHAVLIIVSYERIETRCKTTADGIDAATLSTNLQQNFVYHTKAIYRLSKILKTMTHSSVLKIHI
jgi:hypothetical protein